MTWAEIEKNWHSFKNKIKNRWDKITDADLDDIDGNRDYLRGTIVSRYGRNRDEVDVDIDDFVAGCGCGLAEPASSSTSARATQSR
jgi:uncharacterized protein YjbJ (UPF0337 family)